MYQDGYIISYVKKITNVDLTVMEKDNEVKKIDFLNKTAYNLSRNILLLSTVTERVLSMPITK